MINPQTQIEDHPDGTGNLNAIVNANWHNIVEWFNVGGGLTFSQSGTSVSSSGAIFLPDMVGSTIRFASGQLAVITAYSSSTAVTVTPSQTVTPAQVANIYRLDQSLSTALARGLMKRHRMVAADDGKTIVWNDTTKRFEYSFGLALKQATLTYAASVALDFDSNAIQTVTLAGNITFTTSNKSAGRNKILRIVGDGSTRNFTWPSWTAVGAALPASIASGKVALVKLHCFGTSESDVVARYEVQP